MSCTVYGLRLAYYWQMLGRSYYAPSSLNHPHMAQKILITVFTLLSLAAGARGLRVSSLGASFLIMAAVQQEQKATIFPNPAKDRIYVKGATAARIELINMIGEPVLDEPLTASGLVLLTDIQPGMYIAHIYDADGTVILSTRLTRQ